MGTDPPRRTAVVLQGGGALGAFECGALKALYECRKDFRPAVVTGISIGAVNTAILAGAGLEAVEQTWRERFAMCGAPPAPFAAIPPLYALPQQYLSLLGNEGMYSLRPEYLYAGPAATLFTESFYDATPLRQTLEGIVNTDQLNGDSRVVVTAVNVATGKVANFGNKNAVEEACEGGRENPFANKERPERLTIDHILASGSLPPSFPPTRVEDGSFWDGGLYMNMPLSEAINCLERCDHGSRDVEREVIVVELVPMLGNVPASIPEVMSRFFHILFSSKLELDEKLFAKVNSFIELARRLDEFLGEMPSDSLRARAEEIRKLEGYRELMEYRRINAFTKVSLKHPELANASDFSKAAIEKRIEAGYKGTMEQGIGVPHYLR